MFTFLIILAAIASILLILIVFIQNPKGGGVMSNFSAANQIAGVKKTNDFVEKGTWGLSILLVVFTIASQFLNPAGNIEENPFFENAQNATSNTAPAPTQQNPDAEQFQQPAQQPAQPSQPAEEPDGEL